MPAAPAPFVPWLLQVKKSAKKLQPQGTEPARRPSQKEKRGRSEEKPRARSDPMLPPPPRPPWSPQLRGGPWGPKSVLETAAVEVSGSQDPIRVCRSLPLGDPIPGAPSCIWGTCGCHTGGRGSCCPAPYSAQDSPTREDGPKCRVGRSPGLQSVSWRHLQVGVPCSFVELCSISGWHC